MSKRDEYLNQQRNLLKTAEDHREHAQNAADTYQEMSQNDPDPLVREWAVDAKEKMKSLAQTHEQYIRDLKNHIQQVENLPPDYEMLP